MTSTTPTNPGEDRFSGIESRLDRIEETLESVASSQNNFNEKFDNYQKATQWVVQLAFSLIATANVAIILSAVFK